MASINLCNASIDFPVYNSNSRSLKKKMIQVATGGQVISGVDGRVTVRSLDNVSFGCVDGERIGLVGHNGAGKSTLLRVLGRIYAPSSGSAEIIGQIGSLIDISFGIDHESSGRENIYVRGALLGINKKVIKAKIDEIIEFSELGEFIDLPVRTYSSGMHLRLAFSVATVIRPEILLMDEWLSVGDEGFREKAEVRLGDVISQSKILVISSHSQDLIKRICNRVIWLEHGKIKHDGPADEVCHLYFNSFN